MKITVMRVKPTAIELNLIFSGRKFGKLVEVRCVRCNALMFKSTLEITPVPDLQAPTNFHRLQSKCDTCPTFYSIYLPHVML